MKATRDALHEIATLLDLIESVFLRDECVRSKVASLHRRPVAAERPIVPFDANVNRFDSPGAGLLQRRSERNFRRAPGAWQMRDFPKSKPRIHT